MNLIMLSLSDIFAAVERLRANAPVDGDVPAVAAWAVTNWDDVADSRKRCEDCEKQTRACGVCGMDAR